MKGSIQANEKRRIEDNLCFGHKKKDKKLIGMVVVEFGGCSCTCKGTVCSSLSKLSDPEDGTGHEQTLTTEMTLI